MTRTYKLIDLDCANCARKMEDAINRIDGVEKAAVSFMTQKLTITADDEKFDEIMKKAAKECKKIEPDCTIEIK